ncbi:MAG: replication-relaxation family protein [Chloroflexota bacterium]
MWQVTPRDIEMLQWIGRHGLVTADQLTRKFFAGKRAAYERIRKLTQLGLVERLPTFWKEPGVLRVTKSGSALGGNDVAPANLVLAQIRHDLAVVDLVEQLAAKHPGCTVETEREFRQQRYLDIKERRKRSGQGRIPDGVLHLEDDKTVFIELDLTPKKSRDIERIINAYLSERVDRIWYYCSSDEVTKRVRDVVLSQRADDMIEVRRWSR